jgi:hypothetical protein
MPRSISRVVLLCGLFVPGVAAGGCQRGPTWNLAPVEGTVTQDGRPLANLRVVFLADAEAGTQAPRACGTTDAAGHYELRTDAGDHGAAIGRHRVCLDVAPRRENLFPRAKLPKDGVAEPPAPDTVQLPPAYCNFAETPLRVEVHSGTQVIDLEVK